MSALTVVVAALFLVRLSALRRFRALPLRRQGYFLAAPVPSGFMAAGGGELLRRYHLWLLAPFVADATLSLWLLAGHRMRALLFAQFVLMVLTSVGYNLMAVHFGARAALLAGPAPDRPAVRTFGLSLQPRRLRDHTQPAVELLAAAGAVAALAAAVQGRAPLLPVLWLVYLQVGLLLLKLAFVHWRRPLPAARREEFTRWREGWLAYHLRVFDAVRIALSAVLLAAVGGRVADLPTPWVLAAGLSAAFVVAVYGARERRRLRALERELQPHELVKEFPRREPAAGRFAAGGLLYCSADQPTILVRGPAGLALNLAHPGTYAWAGYLVGLVLLSAWQVSG